MTKIIFGCIISVAIHVLALTTGLSQSSLDRFEGQIVEFERIDQSNGYQPDAMIFTGSSSIRRWTTLESDMSPMRVINRGFGGATLPEVLFYADRIIKPHNPKMVVLYCGDNDLANDSTTAADVMRSFRELDHWLKTNLPDTRLYFLSIKPSVKRWQYWPKMHEANQLIADYMKKESHLRFVDVSSPMLNKKGMVEENLFAEDMLHLNEKGYKIWAKIVRSALLESHHILYDK